MCVWTSRSFEKLPNSHVLLVGPQDISTSHKCVNSLKSDLVNLKWYGLEILFQRIVYSNYRKVDIKIYKPQK